MGQKVNPIGIRLGFSQNWNSTWYAEKKDFTACVQQDYQIREFFKPLMRTTLIDKVEILRSTTLLQIILHSAKPAVLIGKKGNEIEKYRSSLMKILSLKEGIKLTVQEIKDINLRANLVAFNIANQIENRVMFRRALKKAVQTTMSSGAQGVKIIISGRLNGADIARKEQIREGRVPLHVFRAKLDYASVSAQTTYGIIGIKVYIFTGEL
jgi:small subunit ribosomal protein S3